jgi:adenylate cyclase
MAVIIDLAADAGRTPAPHEVRAQLESLLADPAFRASPRRRDFLRFVVEETLAGRGPGSRA